MFLIFITIHQPLFFLLFALKRLDESGEASDEFCALAMEKEMLDIAALENKVVWHLSEPGRQGVKEIPFNGGTIVSTVVFIGGIILTCMGILGLYTSKLYLEVKKRPVYIVKEEF